MNETDLQSDPSVRIALTLENADRPEMHKPVIGELGTNGGESCRTIRTSLRLSATAFVCGILLL